MNSTPKTNLLDLDRQGLQTFFEAQGEKPYRSTQVLQWIHQYGITDFEEIYWSDLAQLKLWWVSVRIVWVEE